MLTIIKTYPWQCIDCKSCAKCNTTHDEESVLDQTTTTTIEQDENEDKYKPLRQADCQRLEIEKQKFNAAIDTLDNTLVRLKQLCLINVRNLYLNCSTMIK
ncbi:unnamed protein product [Rotaria sordida]|uniref:Uncharacterized protein n=1 Tax=Rotaria sordida TaxID=392033 RepID=A0A813VBD4_9BILA|nr:unnamed protein product [Rotaria sordida]